MLIRRWLFVGILALTSACAAEEEAATSTTAVEEGLSFAATTTEPPTTLPPETAPPTTQPPAPPQTQAFVAQPAPAPRSNCDASYPDVCIPPPPPDLDCGDISHRRFRVRPPDPHGFDREGDGIGCESG